MNKSQEVIEPRFMLPGEDEKCVQWIAYGEGLQVLPTVFFMRLEQIPEASIVGFSFSNELKDQARLEAMAHEVSCLMLNQLPGDTQPTTNNRELFQQIYEAAFLQGYRFSVFACTSHGLLELLERLSADQRREVVSRFSYELFMHKPAPDIDSALIEPLRALQEISKAYRSLN